MFKSLSTSLIARGIAVLAVGVIAASPIDRLAR